MHTAAAQGPSSPSGLGLAVPEGPGLCRSPTQASGPHYAQSRQSGFAERRGVVGPVLRSLLGGEWTDSERGCMQTRRGRRVASGTGRGTARGRAGWRGHGSAWGTLLRAREPPQTAAARGSVSSHTLCQREPRGHCPGPHTVAAPDGTGSTHGERPRQPKPLTERWRWTSFAFKAKTSISYHVCWSFDPKTCLRKCCPLSSTSSASTGVL